MIHDKKEFGIGLVLLTGFFIVLFAIFSPLLEGGKNTIDYLDGVFNSISKNSAYYISDIAEKAKKHDGSTVTLSVTAADAGQADRMNKLFTVAGSTVVVDATKLKVSGDLGQILNAVLADADLMFKNEGTAVSDKYGVEAKLALYDWHRALGAMSKDLDKQGKFAASKIVRDAQTKGVEPAYNYYGIEAVPMSSMFWVVLAALVGYVVYTIWYGYAILFLFEGWGLKLEH
ncbi:MAG: hypothetical protein KKF85_04055 [Gammaproteobacteria bacterium]|nr:hypothetical protein [Rhodocyclaceae bacterium]MBU3910285.1 hypothetical protein [Gammaproteobacteria bacterium]MBU3989485.1 hypothetical protein [Gammaproteobacteria bacterium]MBU4004112.1 hypothetical protein [Gammaproteobacteria bacterium]MBU4020359.1 hypothetical protein [Gammaproteobacteria bacterium]